MTLAAASIAFLITLLVRNDAGTSPDPHALRQLTLVAPLPICALCMSIFLLLIFMLAQTYIYETYCHKEPKDRNVYKGRLYAAQLSIGWTGFLNFVVAYGYLVITFVGRI